MHIHATTPLFPWDELDTSPTLGTIRRALDAIPDAPLLAALQHRRHNGCDTYPVTVLWGGACYCPSCCAIRPSKRAWKNSDGTPRSDS